MSSTRTNAEVATVFEAIDDIMEGQGENTFKVKSYRNAVRTLHDLPEILATGTCELYERLKKEQVAAATPLEEEEEDAATGGPVEEPDIPSPW